MLTDFLGIAQSRSPNPFEVQQGYSTPGYGDEVAVGGNIPVSQRPRARLGMFGNSRSAALAQGQAPDAGAGFARILRCSRHQNLPPVSSFHPIMSPLTSSPSASFGAAGRWAAPLLYVVYREVAARRSPQAFSMTWL